MKTKKLSKTELFEKAEIIFFIGALISMVLLFSEDGKIHPVWIISVLIFSILFGVCIGYEHCINDLKRKIALASKNKFNTYAKGSEIISGVAFILVKDSKIYAFAIEEDSFHEEDEDVLNGFYAKIQHGDIGDYVVLFGDETLADDSFHNSKQ